MTFLIYKTRNNIPKMINLDKSIEFKLLENENKIKILMIDDEYRIIESEKVNTIMAHIALRLGQNKNIIDVRKFQQGDNNE